MRQEGEVVVNYEAIGPACPFQGGREVVPVFGYDGQLAVGAGAALNIPGLVKHILCPQVPPLGFIEFPLLVKQDPQLAALSPALLRSPRPSNFSRASRYQFSASSWKRPRFWASRPKW